MSETTEPRAKTRICDECQRDTRHVWDAGAERYVCQICRRHRRD